MVPEIIKILKNDPDEQVRACAAEALGETGSKQALPALRKALKDKSAMVRDKAKEALEQIRKMSER